MRAPRHRFSDSVRSVTRSMAAAMAAEGTVADTPQEMEAWIGQRPEVRGPLEQGGYGELFTATDLFPLLRAMAGKPLEPAPVAPPSPGISRPALLAAGALVVAVLIGVVVGLLA